MGRQIVSSRMFEDIGRNYGYFADPTNLYVVKCKMCVKDTRSTALQAARTRRPYDNYLLSTGSFLVSVSASHLEDVSYQSTMALLRGQNPDTGYAHGGKVPNLFYCERTGLWRWQAKKNKNNNNNKVQHNSLMLLCKDASKEVATPSMDDKKQQIRHLRLLRFIHHSTCIPWM